MKALFKRVWLANSAATAIDAKIAAGVALAIVAAITQLGTRP
jgi:Flp pilus assembly pilin Flp